IGDSKIVRVNTVGAAGQSFKQSRIVQPVQLETRFILFVRRYDLHVGGVIQEGAHDQSRSITEWMHPEQLVRRTVLGLNNTSQLNRCKNHGIRKVQVAREWHV